jgi:hypothetical protein
MPPNKKGINYLIPSNKMDINYLLLPNSFEKAVKNGQFFPMQYRFLTCTVGVAHSAPSGSPKGGEKVKPPPGLPLRVR